MVHRKKASPNCNDVRTALLEFDRAGLRGLVQDLYTASKDNRAFLHARLGLGHDQLQPFKANISSWICPDLMNNQAVSISKAKKAIADYKKAIGRPEGMAELSIFYCEEAFGFLESCSMEDESYFAALIRMYGRSLEFVSNLPAVERATYLERLVIIVSRRLRAIAQSRCAPARCAGARAERPVADREDNDSVVARSTRSPSVLLACKT